jgi:hypothetical protein
MDTLKATGLMSGATIEVRREQIHSDEATMEKKI